MMLTTLLFFGGVSGAIGQPGHQKVAPRIHMDMVEIPAGEFLMGGSHGNEQPRRKVYLDAYLIGKTAITVGQYKAYCADAGIDFSKFKVPAWGWVDNHPMVNVNWRQARDFCKWAGGDLPTEAQWEKAATGVDGREYPWGNEFDPSRLQCSKSAFGDAKSTAPVGSFPGGQSPFGCLDMEGNAWQWCLDYYVDGYADQPDQNPVGPRSGRFHSLRGDGWAMVGSEAFRAHGRWQGDPARQDDYIGFRLVRPLNPRASLRQRMSFCSKCQSRVAISSRVSRRPALPPLRGLLLLPWQRPSEQRHKP
jgi:formylglycine-generating enzyme required for sulfatase activity